MERQRDISGRGGRFSEREREGKKGKKGIMHAGSATVQRAVQVPSRTRGIFGALDLKKPS